MVTCHKCGEPSDLPFVCNYCRQPYCISHRLPEAHRCVGLNLAVRPALSRQSSFEPKIRRSLKPVLQSIFDLGETQQIIVAWLVISLCFSASATASLQIFTQRFMVSLLTVGLGFVLHELAHKYTAQRYGCISGFRIWPAGLGLALSLAILSRGSLIFAAPGAVHITRRSGSGLSRRENGIISASGVSMNLLLAFVFWPVSVLGGSVGSIGRFGSTVNFWLGAFNLIPVSQLDGAKVMAWNMKVWVIMTALAWLGLLFLA